MLNVEPNSERNINFRDGDGTSTTSQSDACIICQAAKTVWQTTHPLQQICSQWNSGARQWTRRLHAENILIDCQIANCAQQIYLLPVAIRWSIFRQIN